jgi:hypothetical protein
MKLAVPHTGASMITSVIVDCRSKATDALVITNQEGFSVQAVLRPFTLTLTLMPLNK